MVPYHNTHMHVPNQQTSQTQSRDFRPPPSISGGGSTIKYPIVIDEGQVAMLRWAMTVREVEKQVTIMTKELAKKVRW